MQGLVFDRASVVQRRMHPGSIVKRLDVLENRLPRLVPGRIVAVMNQFGLEGSEKTFHDGVVPAVALAAHALDDSLAGQQPAEVVAGVLTAAIRMKNQAAIGPSVLDRHLQGVDDQVSIDPSIHRPADDASRKQILDRRQIQPALAGRNIRDIAGPNAVRLGLNKPALQQIRRDRQTMIRIGRVFEFASADGSNFVFPHVFGNRVAAARDALPGQFAMDSRTAVRTSTASVSGSDFGFQPSSPFRPIAGRSLFHA